MNYNPQEIEPRLQQYWRDKQIYRVSEDASRPKFYVLDMFPYPSGAGLHVGHPLGYIASDIYSRYKRLCGFNVLHPMGYDAYGLPAEQYAIQTGQHPEKTTVDNIARYRSQLEKIGFSYDWSREIRTCDPSYYKWTQWAFKRMFESYYDTAADAARPMAELTAHLDAHGTEGLHAAGSKELEFTAAEWHAMDAREKSDALMNWRIAYLGNSMVNWCPALGTVLANDEVSEGLSLRGGYPVEQKMMYQWCLRVSAYAGRLLADLEKLDWTDSLKETQRNWIGRSEGAEMHFAVDGSDVVLDIFTTRADTVFGVTFMVLAPESAYVDMVTTADRREAVRAYVEATKRKTERERMIDKKVSGEFTGAYAVNPLSGARVPIYVSDYVLAGYGTGAIMAVPAHDSRDYAFARHFDLPVVPLIEGADVSEESFDAKSGRMINSAGPELDLNGLEVKDAIAAAKRFIEEKGIGRVKVNYRLRDAILSRQRYWDEPFPVYYKDGIPCLLPDSELPLLLPEISSYKPTADGEPPLARAENWHTPEGYRLESVDDILGIFCLDFTLGIGNRVEGKCFGKILIALNEKGAHELVAVFGEFVELLQTEKVVILAERSLARNDIGLGIVLSLGVREGRCDDCHHIFGCLTFFHCALGIFEHVCLCRSSYRCGKGKNEKSDFLHCIVVISLNYSFSSDSSSAEISSSASSSSGSVSLSVRAGSSSASGAICSVSSSGSASTQQTDAMVSLRFSRLMMRTPCVARPMIRISLT